MSAGGPVILLVEDNAGDEALARRAEALSAQIEEGVKRLYEWYLGIEK